MERKHLSQQIGQILDDLARLSNTLYAMGTADIQRYPDNYEVLSTDAALRAEKIACELRHLIFSTGGIKKAEYHGLACEVHGIEILYEDDVPGSVAINEAVELANRYSEPSSGRFINGVLGTILRDKEAAE